MATPGTVPVIDKPAVQSGDEHQQDTFEAFTKPQQAKIDEIVTKAMGRAARETRAELANVQAQNAQLQAELEAAKATVRDANKTPAERKDAKGEVAELQKQIDEMKNARQREVMEQQGLKDKLTAKEKEVEQAKQEALVEKKQSLINRVATKVADFVDLNTVRKLTEDNIVWDAQSKQFMVVKEDGTARTNANYDPMTVEEFFQEFSETNPYLVRSSMKPGQNSTSSSQSNLGRADRVELKDIFGKGSNSKLANEIGIKDPKRYSLMRAEAKAKGLIS